MHRWFVAFSYRKNPEAPVAFSNLVCSTPDAYFSFAHVAQRIADDHQYSDVQIINWKQLQEIEFLAYEGWKSDHGVPPTRDVEQTFEGVVPDDSN